MTLADCPPGLDVRVLSNRGASPAATRRMAEMGLRAGTVLRIQSRTSGGGAVLAIGDDRLAVAATILRGIDVTPAAATPQAGAHPDHPGSSRG